MSRRVIETIRDVRKRRSLYAGKTSWEVAYRVSGGRLRVVHVEAQDELEAFQLAQQQFAVWDKNLFDWDAEEDL